MMMWIGAAVVARGTVAVRQLGGEPATDERFKRFVNSGQRDIGNVVTHRREDVVCGGMRFGAQQVAIYSGTLIGIALAVSLEGFAQHYLSFAGRRADAKDDEHGGSDAPVSPLPILRSEGLLELPAMLDAAHRPSGGAGQRLHR